MIISELIEKLEKFKEDHGDLTMYYDDLEWGPTEILEIEFLTPSQSSYFDKTIIPERCNLAGAII